MYLRILGSALLAASAVAFTPAAELAGRFQGSLPTPIGELAAVYEFVPDGDSFRGSLVLSGSDAFPIADGKVRGDSVFFSVDLSAVVLHHRGLLAGDTLAVMINDGTAEFGAKLARVKAN
jgi:hypothetical protein